MSQTQQILRDLAKRVRSTVLVCRDYDPNVCSFSTDPKNPAKIATTSGQPFLTRTSYDSCDQRIRLEANDSFLKIQIPFDTDIEPIGINKTDRIQSLVYSGEVAFANRRYPVFTKDGSLNEKHAALLQRSDFLNFVSGVALTAEEGIHIYSNGISIYLYAPSVDRVLLVSDLTANLMSGLERHAHQADLSSLPLQFSLLAPLIQMWGVLDESQREDRREGMSRLALQALVEEVSPYLPAINSYLDTFGKSPLPEGAVALATLAEFIAETELQLNDTR